MGKPEARDSGALEVDGAGRAARSYRPDGGSIIIRKSEFEAMLLFTGLFAFTSGVWVATLVAILLQ